MTLVREPLVKSKHNPSLPVVQWLSFILVRASRIHIREDSVRAELWLVGGGGGGGGGVANCPLCGLLLYEQKHLGHSLLSVNLSWA